MNYNHLVIANGDELLIPAGTHTLTEPIRITASNVIIRGEDGAELRAVKPLSDCLWHETDNGILYTEIDADTTADALYIGDRKYRMARYPKFTSDDLIFGGYAADCTEPSKTAQWNDPSGGYIHAMHRHMWGGYSYRITGKQENGELSLIGGWQNNRQMGMHEEYRYAENIFEELTEPGEWFYDEKRHRIFVIPCPGDDLTSAEIAVSHGFFVLDGAQNVRIENLTFSRSSRTFMHTREPLLRSDWTIFRGGAVMLQDSHNCMIDRCTFSDIGSNAVFVSGSCEDIAITRCHIRDIGASGVCFVGKPESVRNPLFEYNQTLPFSALDLTLSPKSDQYVRHCRVEDCLISHTGTVEKQSAGVQISMAAQITVRNCTVCHMPRAGINISEGTFGGHLIEGCDVFDTVRETGDHGSFNSWGRDRFWHAPGLADEDAHRYMLLDCTGQTVIRRNRFRCDHGWDIDLDDGSSNYIIEQNLCLSGGIKLREGFFRSVRKNITVGNTVHFHVWYPNSGDTVTDNLVFTPWAPIGMPQTWGETVNHNILHTAGIPSAMPADPLSSLSRQDTDSVMLDTGIALDEQGTVMLHSASAPFSQFFDFPCIFGVRYAPLRAIADVPSITDCLKNTDNQTQIISHWGASLKNIDIDGEMSVYGTAGHTGVLVLEVAPESASAQIGLCANDVITAIDGISVAGIDRLLKHFPTTLTVLRRQTTVNLTRTDTNESKVACRHP